MNNSPKILLLDIETAPILARVWRLFDENVGLEQIEKDWHVLSWAAKWLDEKKIFYQDQRSAKNIEDDKEILKGIWDLLDEADIVITQNGVSFDIKKLNARFIINGMQPPSPFKNIDTKLLAQKKFSFTSNKLEYLTDKLCTKYKKLKHGKFPHFSLWSEVLKGNIKAWQEMKKYNIHDILSLEELYKKLIAWDSNGINFSIYNDSLCNTCTCGNTSYKLKGFHYTTNGKYRRYACKRCGKSFHDKENLLLKDKKDSIMSGIR